MARLYGPHGYHSLNFVFEFPFKSASGFQAYRNTFQAFCTTVQAEWASAEHLCHRELSNESRSAFCEG
jgi:hypothetical protein